MQDLVNVCEDQIKFDQKRPKKKQKLAVFPIRHPGDLETTMRSPKMV